MSCSVGAGYALALFEVVERLGVAREDLLARAAWPGLAAVDWQQATARLPMAALIALFEAAVALSGRRDMGLEFGRRVRPGTFNVLGYALMTCRNLGEAIALVPLYRRLVFDPGYSETALALDGETAILEWRVMPGTLPYCAVLAESLLASWLAFGRWISGRELALAEVRFCHPPPTEPAPFVEFFACPVRFEAGINALVFPRALLDLPLVQADASLHLAMRSQAQAAVQRLPGEDDLGGRVRQALLALMPKCEAGLTDVAAALGMHPRTLQRRLDGAGLRFQELLDATRKEMAALYLRDPALSLLDVALLLGYAEQSSFTRAFKAWYGVAPSRSPARAPLAPGPAPGAGEQPG